MEIHIASTDMETDDPMSQPPDPSADKTSAGGGHRTHIPTSTSKRMYKQFGQVTGGRIEGDDLVNLEHSDNVSEAQIVDVEEIHDYEGIDIASPDEVDAVEEIDVVSVEEVEAHPIQIAPSTVCGENAAEGSRDPPKGKIHTIKAAPVRIKKVKLKRINLKKLRMPNKSRGYNYNYGLPPSPSPPQNSPVRTHPAIGQYASHTDSDSGQMTDGSNEYIEEIEDIKFEKKGKVEELKKDPGDAESLATQLFAKLDSLERSPDEISIITSKMSLKDQATSKSKIPNFPETYQPDPATQAGQSQGADKPGDAVNDDRDLDEILSPSAYSDTYLRDYEFFPS